MAYQWTDWITHVPGQQLWVGAYALCEFVGACPTRKGALPYVPYQVEGLITSEHLNHPVWRMTDVNGTHCKLLRYKLRSVVDDQTAEQRNELTEVV